MRAIFFMTFAMLFAIGTQVKSANADTTVHFCSEVPYRVHVVLGYTNEHGWQSRGWYRLLPGDCITPNIGSFNNRTWYYYAHSDRQFLRWRDQDGPRFCVSYGEPFHLTRNLNRCETERFIEVEMENGTDNFTMTLTCDDCFDDPTRGETFGGEPRLRVYGRWCGTGHPSGPHPGAPIDGLDHVCHDHDRAYHHCNRTTNGAERTECEANADLRMVADLAQLAGTGQLNPEQLAYASVMATVMVTAAQARYGWAIARNIEAEGERFLNRVERDVTRIAEDARSTLETHLQNAWNDITRGPGPNNEICRHTPLC